MRSMRHICGTVCLAVTILAAVFTAIHFWVIENAVLFGIGAVCTIVFGGMTILLNQSYKKIIFRLIDLF